LSLKTGAYYPCILLKFKEKITSLSKNFITTAFTILLL